MTTVGSELPKKRFIPIKVAAEFLGLSSNTLYSWTSQGLHLPVIKFGRRVFIDAKDLEEFIEVSKRKPRNVNGDHSNGRVQ